LTIRRNRDAEVVICLAITGDELHLLGPLLSGAGKNISGTLKGVPAYRSKVRADNCGIAGEGNTLAEIVKRNSVGSTDLRLLGPVSACECKHVCGAAVRFTIERSAKRATERGVTIERHSEAEPVKRLPVIGY
jgi:hypothetical protein